MPDHSKKENKDPKNMKIGFDAKRAMQNFTGLGNYSRFVITNLSKFYPDNEYELFSPKFTNHKLVEDIVRKNSISIYTKKKYSPFWRSRGIVKDIRNERVEIYHGLSNELPFQINKVKVKTIVTIHDLIFLKYPHFYPLMERHIYNIKARYACKVADKIVAVSECTKRDIIEHYDVAPEKIDVVYQGCFAGYKETMSDAAKKEVKEKYDLPDNYILSIGSIEDRKNILLVVKALKYLPNTHFVAIGRQRKYAEKVIKYAERHGLTERVHIISDVPSKDLPTILQCCDVFVYPSLYEGFGIPIIEALNSGVPVIGAIGSCLEEAGGPHSIYVSPYDEQELAIQIKRVKSDPELRNKMIEEGYKYVQRFTDEKCTDSLMKVYKSIL